MLLILSFELIGSKTYISPHSPILRYLEIIGLPLTEKARRSRGMEDKVQINGILTVYKALCQPPVLKRKKGGRKEKGRRGRKEKKNRRSRESLKERKEIQPEMLLFQGFSLTASSNSSDVRRLISHVLHLLGESP